MLNTAQFCGSESSPVGEDVSVFRASTSSLSSSSTYQGQQHKARSLLRIQKLLQRLLFRIRSVKKAKNNKYILLNAPDGKLDQIISLLPGMKSPTVLPLAEPGWHSVHSVIDENDFWNIIEQLKEAGAQGILVVPIEKMII